MMTSGIFRTFFSFGRWAEVDSKCIISEIYVYLYLNIFSSHNTLYQLSTDNISINLLNLEKSKFSFITVYI